MTKELRTLCERLSQGLDRDPHELALRLGTVDHRGSDGWIRVAPSGATFSAANIWASPDSGTTTTVNLVPGVPLTLENVRTTLGPYSESPRLHPHDPRKAVFSPWPLGSHPFFIAVIAYVSADELLEDSAAVQRLTITCSPTPAADIARPQKSANEPPAAPVWPPFLAGRVSFELGSWRQDSLSDVRSELERVLGVKFKPSHEKVYDGEPAFECELPACELRLNAWPAVEPRLTYFNFIALSPRGQAPPRPPAEDVGEALAAYLRNAGCDWYVPDLMEGYESDGLLGARILEPDVVVSVLAPRWLAWTDAEQNEQGRALLGQIAELWVTAARRTADPVADVARRRVELEEWGLNVPPRSRLRILITYAIQEQLSSIHEQLFELSLMNDGERELEQDLEARLAEWRQALDALAEPVRQTGNDVMREQLTELCAELDKLGRSTRRGG